MARRRPGRTRPHPGASARSTAPTRDPARPGAVPRAVSGARLPLRLTSRQLASVVAIAVFGTPAFSAFFDSGDWLDQHRVVVFAGIVVPVFAMFALEQQAILRRPQASLRFAGSGVLAPVLWWFLNLGSVTPIGVVAGLGSWYLGLGSVVPPAIVATLTTSALHGPVEAYVALTAWLWCGLAALLLSRRPGR